MYPAPFRYHRATTLDEAIALLTDLGETAKPLAGGQSLIPMLKLRMDEPSDLVDIGRVPALSYVERDPQSIRIGALATHARIANSDIAAEIPILKDCAGGIADAQVRSRGTIGGSVSAADPNSDWPALLQTLDAQIVCTGPEGVRTVPIRDFVADAYTTALGEGELVTEIRFPVPAKNSKGAYTVFKRAAPAYPVVSAGVQLTLEGDICQAARIVLGGAGPTPRVASQAEEWLRGKPLSPNNLEQAAEAVIAVAEPPADVRGSAEFKQVVLRALFLRAADTALRRCGGQSIEGTHQYV